MKTKEIIDYESPKMEILGVVYSAICAGSDGKNNPMNVDQEDGGSQFN